MAFASRLLPAQPGLAETSLEVGRGTQESHLDTLSRGLRVLSYATGFIQLSDENNIISWNNIDGLYLQIISITTDS